MARLPRLRRSLEYFMAILLGVSALIFLTIEYRQSKVALWKMQEDLSKYIHKIEQKKGGNLSSSKPKPESQKKARTLKPQVHLGLHTLKENTLISTEVLFCHGKPKSLLGRVVVDVNKLNALGKIDDDDLLRNSSDVHVGGWWEPDDCKPRAKVAILVPLRNRPKQLQVFLRHITPVLQRQMLHYRIFVVEQIGKTAFNKGAIYNLAFNTTLRYDDYDCYVFHDVDLLTEHDHNYYGCPASPLHMSTAIDKFKYKLPYPNIFGGIQAFKKEHYIKVNGFSNQYWGWGAEDDDMFRRVKKAGLKLQRSKLDIGRYKMNQGEHFRSPGRKIWEARNKGLLFYHPANQGSEGLNTTSTLTFDLKIQEKKLYTYISVDLTFTG